MGACRDWTRLRESLEVAIGRLLGTTIVEREGKVSKKQLGHAAGHTHAYGSSTEMEPAERDIYAIEAAPAFFQLELFLFLFLLCWVLILCKLSKRELAVLFLLFCLLSFLRYVVGI